ncbi:MAG: CHAT domain-containing tetratricopeptide repeat protein [Lyngbya sp.]|nr:CHAT domain-containing tetratricopeptide repeat protein [Lyngbya sp.]
MKRTSLNPFLWLTALVGCSGLLTGTPQPVTGQTNSSVLLAQRISQPQDVAQFNSAFKELEDAPSKFQALEEAAQFLKELEEVVQKLELAVYYIRESKLEQARVLLEQAFSFIQRIPVVYDNSNPAFTEQQKDWLIKKLIEIFQHEEIDKSEEGALTFYQAEFIKKQFFSVVQYLKLLIKSLQLAMAGKSQEAVAIFDEAESIIKELDAERKAELEEAYRLNKQAYQLAVQGKYNEAIPLAERSLEIIEIIQGENHPRVATSLNNLGLYYTLQGRFDEAEPLLQRSLVLQEEYQRSLVIRDGTEINPPGVTLRFPPPTSLNNLGLLYLLQGRYDEAEPLYQRSLAMWEKFYGENHPNVAVSLSNLALLYLSQGDTTQAINFLSRGLEVQEQNLNVLLATGSERQKQDSMKTVSSKTDFAVSLHIKDAPNNSEAARLALTTILRRKGRILDVMTNDLQLLQENITPENQQFLDELATVRTQLATLIYNQPENISEEQYRQQVASLRQKSEQLEAELSRRSAEFRTLSEPVTIEAVQQLIPEDAALVEFVLYEPYDAKARQWGNPHYAAYILKSDGEPQWVDLGEAEPIHRAAFFRFNLALKDKKDAFIGNSDKVKQTARQLDELLMQPIREKLGNVNHIIISPDAQLNLIPFAALVDENNQYMIETYNITYLTTGRDLIRLQLEYSHKQNPVIVANPDYDKPGEPTTVAVSNNSESPLNPPMMGDLEISPQSWGDRGGLSQTRGINQLSRDVEMSVGALPGTAEEANIIAPLLADVTLFTQSQATENAVKQLQAPKILHVATHGFFLKNLPRVEPDNTFGFISENTQQNTPIQENPLLRSGLALAGFNPRESGSDDGVLTALEVANLRLRGTKLVVLSACETGLGEVENGEGVYGLRRAFTLAGAESQLMSLWKVNDEGTKDLMIKYYQRILQNQGRSDAWRQTQLEMLNSQQYQHPYFWAAFVPVGDWTPMEF